jgi:hypothetical protein
VIKDSQAFRCLGFDFACRGLRGLFATSEHERAVIDLDGDDNADDQRTKRQPERVCDVCVSVNVTRGPGLDHKEIRWSIDNVDKVRTRTVRGYAALNLTIPETQDLSIGKHVLTIFFNGDADYTPSHATTTFQVQIAPTPSASPSAVKENASVT